MNIKEQIVLFNQEIKEANEIIINTKVKIRHIQLKCKHEDIEVNSWGTADCNICEKHFDWYCPTSPTLECDYEQDDGSYDEDCCRYCGQPEERK